MKIRPSKTLTKTKLVAGFLLAVAAIPAIADELLLADFEQPTYGDWKAEGEAFGPGPATGTLPGQQEVSGFKGKRLVNSFHGGDGTTGTLTSPPFIIERDYISFLVGGGGHEGKTCINLVVDGNTVATATGPNTEPGGSEELEPAFWEVGKYKGKSAVIRIVDRATGGWGHINVDHIVQTDTKPSVPPRPARHEKSFMIDSKYLVMPIANGSKGGTLIHLYVGDEKVRQYQFHPAPSADAADWHAFFTIDRHHGKPARLVVDRISPEGFDLIRQSDTVPREQAFYQEPHRPQFHFTHKVGWINDPNGMVWHSGKWHLFFQHNPVGLPWGNMTWGHATSTDLVHWEQQPNKLFPKTMAVGDCFSGGATVDKHNTAGWGENTLVAFFTDTGCGESIAYSTDGGETFTCYEGNPVVKHNGRDPKVIWYDYGDGDTPIDDTARKLGGHWVMVVYNERQPFGRNLAFHTSTNLKDWTERSNLPGYYECPELFKLAIEPSATGDSGGARWVVFGADAQYAIGSFDGMAFTPEHEGTRQVHWGPYYASQTFENVPDGRRIQIGWVRIDSPGPYNQHFSFPHQLTLHATADGLRMFAKPVHEIENLRDKSHRTGAAPLVDGKPLELPVASDLLDVRLEIEPGDAKVIKLDLPGRLVTYNAAQLKLNEAPLAPVDGRIRIQVLADRSLTEIIGNDGRVFITAGGSPAPGGGKVTVTAQGGTAKLISLEAHELKSIWKDH